jgi:hypothetical protein
MALITSVTGASITIIFVSRPDISVSQSYKPVMISLELTVTTLTHVNFTIDLSKYVQAYWYQVLDH